MLYYVTTVYIFIYYVNKMTSSISVEIHGMQINDDDDDDDIIVDGAVFSFKIFNPHRALRKIQTINIGCVGLDVFGVLKGQ